MMFQLTPIVKFLLILNVGMYILSMMFGLDHILAIHSIKSPYFIPSQFLTYMFSHDRGSLMHLFFNMLIFAQFGPQLESYLGSKRFGNFVMVCGVSVGVSWMLINTFFLHNIGASMHGFSGVLFGVYALLALYFPYQRIQLMFIPFDFKLRNLAFAIIGYNVFMLINGSGGNISYLAHVLGVVFALLLHKVWQYLDSRDI